MKIKSKLRLDIVLICTCISILATILLCLGYRRISERFDKNMLTEPSIFLMIIFISLLFALVIFSFFYEIVTKTLVITINAADKTVILHYPFKFKKKNYLFNEFAGFRFSSFYTGICSFKTLILKSTDNCLYTIPEIQIANFKEFETFVVENFDLKKGADFISLTGEEKASELTENLNFTIQQARTYRSTCYFYIGMIVVLLIIDECFAIPGRRFGWIGFGFFFAYFLFLLFKINQANKTIRNLG